MSRGLLVPDTGRARACVVDPVLFGSTDVLDHTLAARSCDVCPVRVACRAAVDADPAGLVGTYAGRRFNNSPSERDDLTWHDGS